MNNMKTKPNTELSNNTRLDTITVTRTTTHKDCYSITCDNSNTYLDVWYIARSAIRSAAPDTTGFATRVAMQEIE